MEKNRGLEIKTKLEVLRTQCKPTDIWQTYLDEDDELGVFYTQESIDVVSNVLDQFIQDLIDIDDYNNGKFIEGLVHKLIVEINDISHKYEGMIETNEREELVEFINSILDTIEYDYIGDVTEQWREW